jgi:hypothetical protein
MVLSTKERQMRFLPLALEPLVSLGLLLVLRSLKQQILTSQMRLMQSQ